MTDRQPEEGITRRELLKKGALLGGTLVWSTPVVQLIGMHPAMAQTVSPVDISYVELQVECSGEEKPFWAKFEFDGKDAGWTEPGATPCPGVGSFDPDATKVDGEGVGWSIDMTGGPCADGSNAWVITVPKTGDPEPGHPVCNATDILWTAEKCGQECEAAVSTVVTSTAFLVTFCPCPPPS